MVRKLGFAASLALLTGMAPAEPVPGPASLHLTFEGLRSAKGSIRLCVWRDSEGFPDCKKNANVVMQSVPAAQPVKIDLTLDPGEYAVSAIHDENDNRKLDKSFIGMPTEGVAFSNNAKIVFGPPKYEAARFHVEGATTHSLRMRYFL